MKTSIVISLAVVCAILLLDATHAHDDHGKPDKHLEELQEMLSNKMMPEIEDFPRFRRSADSDNQGGDQSGGNGGGGRGGKKGPGGPGGPGGRGGQGDQGQQQGGGQ